MCSHHETAPWYKRRSFLFLFASLVAFLSAYSQISALIDSASFIADLFMKLLKLVSIPILFFSLMTVFSSLENNGNAKKTVSAITRYTFLTTIIAAAVALGFVHLFGLVIPAAPIGAAIQGEITQIAQEATQFRYSEWLLNAVPSNIIDPFSDNNAIAALILALLLGFSTSRLPSKQRETIHSITSSVYKLLMETTLFIVRFLPIILWAFLTLLFHQISSLTSIELLFKYLLAIFFANMIQGLLILPGLLKYKKISPIQLAKSFFPALTMAFITKSSSATVPLAIRCATTRASIRESTATISFPLCTSINMNGCAAFILITVLFVGSMNGVTFTLIDQCVWILIATLAAVGNAGIPMGCYFLSCALLASMGVSLNILGAILPFYAIVDAVETALNVWSDCSITAIVDKETV